jgi:CHAD domain-containing protein
MLEREVKLEVDGEFDLDRIDPPPGLERSASRRKVQDRYFDTEDLRLARWGATLRHRRGEGWTVKLPSGGDGSMLARPEIAVPGAAAAPPARALALLGSLTRGAAVHEVARLATTRAVVDYSDAEGRQLQVSDDHVVPLAPATAGFREVEVELAPGADEALLGDVVDRLIGAGARRTAQTPKLVRVLGERAAGPADVVVPLVLDQPTAREVIHAAIARSAATMLLQLPLARLGEDPESLHQARVATRRLRSDLRTFKPLVDPVWSASLQDELRWLAATLGEVRDADVLAAKLARVGRRHPEIDPEPLARVMGVLERQRSRSRAKLLRQLKAKRAEELFDHVVAAALDPITAPQADEPAEDQLPALVRKRWRRLQRTVDRLDAEPETARLHEVRLLAKRTRYAAEAVAPAFGRDAGRFAKAMSRIQDVLGELNDAAVAEGWLAAAAGELDGEAAYAAGRLVQVVAVEAIAFRHGWEQAYAKASRRRLRSWFE